MLINSYRFGAAAPPSDASAIYSALVAWWSMHDSAADSMLRDGHAGHHLSLRYSNAAANTSARTTTGLVGRAMNLIGTDNSTCLLPRTDTACDGNIDQDYSFGGWFKTAMASGFASIVIGRSAWSAGTATMYVGFDTADNKLRIYLRLNAGGTQTIATTIAENNATWQFIVATYNKTANKLELRYRAVGGAFQYFSATLTGIVNAASSVANFVVGEHAESGLTQQVSTNRNGVYVCDECFYANKAVSDDEFDYLFNAGAGKSYAQLVFDAIGAVLSPVVEARASSVGIVASNHTITMPAGIVAGNLLLVFFCCEAASAISTYTGWSKLQEAATGSLTTDVRMAVFAKIAAGGDTLTVSITGGTSYGAHASLRMAGTISSLANVSSAIVASSLDPPAVTPAHGADYYTAVAALGWINNAALSTFPTDYLGGVNPGNPTVTERTGVAFADKTLAAGTTTEDPGAFTGTMSTGVAVTVLVHSG